MPRGQLSVAIPASVISDTPHLREKTGKLGVIARACSIFGVNEIMLYLDSAGRDQKADLELCEQILTFIETPQYLRKRIFQLNPNLRFAGILPPLQTPHHNIPSALRESKVGDVRDGVVIARRKSNLLIDVGLEKPIECHGNLAVGTRVTARLKSIENLQGEILDQSSTFDALRVPYWGYKVATSNSLGGVLENNRFDLTIGTSRYGSSLADVWPSLSIGIKDAKSILVAYGSPRTGLKEILSKEQLSPENVFNYFVNMVPDQKTATVRTEEALMISLGILNWARLSG